METH
jgi:hypothetical protein